MRNVISFPIRTYVDFETLPTSKDSQQKPKHDGTLVKVSVNPATVLTDNHTTELVNFVRRFRQWKWKGSKHVVVPVARAPVDPAHITYNANQPSVDPFDLMLFHAYKRWKNNFQTIPPPTENFAERYFLMDPSWRKASLLRPFSMFTRPYVSNIAQMMQTSHFTIPSAVGSVDYPFDASGLRAVPVDQTTFTGKGVPGTTDLLEVQPGTLGGPITQLQVPTSVTDVNNHRHNFFQERDGEFYRHDGMVRALIEHEPYGQTGVVDTVKRLIHPNSTTTDSAWIKPYSRGVCRQVAPAQQDGVDQANLTGTVATTNAEPNRPSGSPSDKLNWGTDTAHGHNALFVANDLEQIATSHIHMLSDGTIGEIQEEHHHSLPMSNITGNMRFNYNPPNIPPQSMPWWSTSSDSFISGRRRVRGWQDTRQASFITGSMTDSVYSPTWPAFLWRIPCHYHTKYAFRMWITHWFALRSPILHELYVPTTDAVDGMMEEEGVLDMSIRTPSAVAGIEGFTPETNEWIKSILANADAEIQQQKFTDQPTE